ncbi:MAG: GNAT family N-acetyltransferase [Thermovenabulum sp.]|uniref:GNAT family N-acetyltransferase n=1 Tax=Thermovenabulum sp. TaxID=3100335 RepID=UPI003C7AFC6B
MVIFRRAKKEDFDRIKEIVTTCSLCGCGLEKWFSNFMVIEEDEKVIGTGGLEIYGEYAVLRSVAVLPEFRNQGLGDGLVRSLINLADRLGVKTIYLFTEKAMGFFEKIGFKKTSREEIQEKCPNTDQLSGCPLNATPMKLDINEFFSNIKCK